MRTLDPSDPPFERRIGRGFARQELMESIGAGWTQVARGRVTVPGPTLTVSAGDVFAATGGEEKRVATMPAIMMGPPARAASAE